jgi:hypothetical protein
MYASRPMKTDTDLGFVNTFTVIDLRAGKYYQVVQTDIGLTYHSFVVAK